jgi:hypothetical protein
MVCLALMRGFAKAALIILVVLLVPSLWDIYN